MIPKYTIIQYVRKKRIPYGVLVAVRHDPGHGDGFFISYSLCSKKDLFNKRMALKIALGRASTGYNGDSIPHPVKKMIPAFYERCKKYYKQTS